MINENMTENMNKSMYVNTKGKLITGIIIGAFFGWLITWIVMVPKKTTLVRQPIVTSVASGYTPKELGLYHAMSRLWSEHIWWTREYLKSNVSNNKDSSLVAARLLKNQEDIGNAVKTIYGEAVGAQLTDLLKTHVQGAINLVAAIKSGDQKAITEANTGWYANADHISSFLATANPNWSLTDLTTMMRTHLDLTKQEAFDLIGEKNDVAITDFQNIEDEILVMSDSLSQGIIKQFPQNFK